jgi:glycosyltransferase involved in cell wall biosynthesis
MGSEPVAVYVGRLAAEKNLPLAVEAFHRMRSAEPRARLVFVGDGPERAALERRHEGFVFAGMRTGVDLAEHYASADVFLFPSTTETYGNVTAEAMASGLAVVAFDHAAAAELIRHGENGLKAPPGDRARFVELGRQLATNPEDIRRLRQNARQSAEKLDWETIHDRFERVLLSAACKEMKNDATSRLSFVPD